MKKSYCVMLGINAVAMALCICTSTLSANENGIKVYNLKFKAQNSDFNYVKLKNLDKHIVNTRDVSDVLKIFAPTKGKFNYFQFIAEYKGDSYASPIDLYGGNMFHDILIVKTGNDGEIIDGFQYTLEWAEPPLQYDLHRISANKIKLIDGLDISTLKFTQTYQLDEHYPEPNEQGVLQVK